MSRRQDLRREFAEDQNNNRQRSRCEQADRVSFILRSIGGYQVGRQAGGGNIGDGASQENNSQKLFRIADDAFYCLRTFVSGLSLIFQTDTIHCHKGSFRGREKHRQQKEQKKDKKVSGQGKIILSGSSFDRALVCLRQRMVNLILDSFLGDPAYRGNFAYDKLLGSVEHSLLSKRETLFKAQINEIL